MEARRKIRGSGLKSLQSLKLTHNIYTVNKKKHYMHFCDLLDDLFPTLTVIKRLNHPIILFLTCWQLIVCDSIEDPQVSS